MLNILVVEDSFREMEYTCTLIKNCLPDSRVEKAGDVKTALAMMDAFDVDIFFLDIDLPDGNGFQIAQKIRRKEKYLLTTIVFTTAVKTNQLAVHKRYHHYEYLEKPYTPEGFASLINPVLKKLDKEKGSVKPTEHDNEKMLLIETRDQVLCTKASSVLYVQAQMRKLTLVTKEGTISNIPMTLEAFLKQNEMSLDRTHKSFAANVDNIKAIGSDRPKSWQIRFDHSEDVVCPLGITYYENILTKFKERQTGDTGDMAKEASV